MQKRNTEDDSDPFAQDQRLNRHIVNDHVGKTDEELKAYIRSQQFRGLFYSTGRDRHGSFETIESARDFIDRTIDNNPDAVSRVARGESNRELLTWRFGNKTGREAYLDLANGAINIRTTYNVGVVIEHDPQAELGYRIVTAYPRNFNPRIGR